MAATTSSHGKGAEEETLDSLAGDLRIFQLRRGHRYTTDDVLTAWTALCALPCPGRILDLGAGVGSVGLMVLLRAAPLATLTSVEIQQISADLMVKTVAYNGLEERVRVLRADLRDPDLLVDEPPFDLICANPPYLPAKRAMRSPHPQRAAARLELNGDVFDYCHTTARLLSPDGRLSLCHAAADPRPVQAVERAGLKVLCRQEVFFRAGRPPALALLTCGWRGAREDRSAMTVRDAQGERTETYRQVRKYVWIEA